MKELRRAPELILRDELYKKFGPQFRSSHQDHGSIVSPMSINSPWDDCFADNFYKLFKNLRSEFSFHLLTDMSLENVGDKTYLHYSLLSLETYFRLQVSFEVIKGPFIPGLSFLWKSAHGLEKELEELHGMIVSDGSRSRQRHILEEGKIKTSDVSIARGLPRYDLPIIPTEKDLIKKWYQVGPLSGPLKGKARVDFLIDDESVYDCIVETGFCHRNFEKMIIGKPFESIGFYMERLCSRDSIFAPLIWNEALESRYHIFIPEKAQAIRMVWMEIARIEGHLIFLQELTAELGFLIESSALSELVEQIYHLYNLHCGKNQNFTIFTVGGMKNELPMNWPTECLEMIKYIQKELESIQSKVVRNKSWMGMTFSCPMSAMDAIEYGLTGPNLRACGVNYDLRKRRPHYFYSDVDFEVPLGIDGMTYDRFLVRSEEVKQSIKIINQVLDHLPAGQVNIPGLEMEGLRLSSDEQQSALTYNMIESTEGELGILLRINGDNSIGHFHVRSPSYVHLNSFPHLAKGEAISNVLTAFLSLGIDAWEMDR